MDVEDFIARWRDNEGGQERANYGLFLSELSDVLGVQRPDPANRTPETNDYVLERIVQDVGRDGAVSSKRIDLYKRDCFVLEAKQSRQPGGKKELPGQLNLPNLAPLERGRRGAHRAWDVLMLNARQQAENYVRLLPKSHQPPPFVLVCDVGHCIEVYANFRRDGKAYDQFPDRQSFRVYLEDLRKPDIRQRLAAIWTDPFSLDPARHAARVTRDIAERLAEVSKSLEARKFPAEEVAAFLQRCLFTMFAEDVGLLPPASFKDVLERCEADPTTFVPDVQQLWEAMDKGGYAHAIRKNVPRFNGEFFAKRTVLPLGREEIGELKAAAGHDWTDVDPSIFGTLLEQALDPGERRALGAHYTPRAYVERLVIATVIEPLREDWGTTRDVVERLKSENRHEAAIRAVQKFHDKLCATRVLDPACGTGNFLYVALELLKRLEGEVLETLADLGGQEALRSLESHEVDPKQFLGLELNPRAAAIAELVLWIGHLQWHVRTRGGMPNEPILKAFHNIRCMDAVLKDSDTQNPRRPEWPMAEFIVGNPPFIGGKDLRARLGDAYAEALWSAHKLMNESADFVMYWWDRAAELLTAKGTVLQRFGFVTTNSISQVFQRRVMERHLTNKKPVSLVFAVPDHPWTKVTRDSAAVRIAMTVARAGRHDGVLRETTREAGLDTDTPQIDLTETRGRINADLTVGVDVTTAKPMKANDGLCSPGVKLHGAGFIVTPSEAEHLGLGRRPGLERHIRHYRNGRDLTARSRGVMVIDLYGLEAEAVRQRFPEVYQHVMATVKPERDANNRASYRDNWWIFGEPRKDLRPALADLPRYIATVETTKHRVFQFLDAAILPDNKLVAIGSADAFHHGVLSSRIHGVWALRAGGWLGMGNDPVYVKTSCFDPFPFPAATPAQQDAIRVVAEHLDAHRKRVLEDHPHLTLTKLYNVLERLRAGATPATLDDAERLIFDDGLVLILREYHDALDAAVADAYGWPAGLADSDILARLVALNAERAREEKRGKVRWLRPEYQIPRFGTPKEKAELDLQGGASGAEVAVTGPKPAFPPDEWMQTAAVRQVLADAPAPLSPLAVAMAFKQGRKVLPKVEAVLRAAERTGRATRNADQTYSAAQAA